MTTIAGGLPLVADASVLIPIFIPNSTSAAIKRFLRAEPRRLIVSDFAAGEVAAVVSRYVRMDEIDAAHGRAVLATFDAWRMANTIVAVTEPADIRRAESFVRQFELRLRLPDALYLATALRLEAGLLTCDITQAAAASALGLSVAPL
jgi:predicted nucleic acid-binding protein